MNKLELNRKNNEKLSLVDFLYSLEYRGEYKMEIKYKNNDVINIEVFKNDLMDDEIEDESDDFAYCIREIYTNSITKKHKYVYEQFQSQNCLLSHLKSRYRNIIL